MLDIDQKIKDAKAYGYIALDTLALVLARDDSYNFIIPLLWERYKLYKNGGAKTPNTDDYDGKVSAWGAIVYRLAFGLVNGQRDHTDDGPPYLPLVYRDEDSRNIVPLKGFIDPLKRITPLVLLKDLDPYLTNIIGIHMPEALVVAPIDSSMTDIDEIGETIDQTGQSADEGALPKGYIGRFQDKKDGIWEITYKGKTVLYNDLKGLQYIAMLLEKPNIQIPAIVLAPSNSDRPEPKGKQLQNIVEYTTPKNPETHDESEDIAELTVLRAGDLMSGVALNSDELNKIEDGLQALYDRIQTNPGEQSQSEFEEMKAFYEDSEGILVAVFREGKVHIKSRARLNQDGDKARQSVRRAIKYAYKKMGDADNHPKLLDFLRTHITTGGNCEYKVDTALDHRWDVTW